MRRVTRWPRRCSPTGWANPRHSFEQQPYRASGLNLVTAGIVLRNTVYLERVANALHNHGQGVDDALLQYLSPLGWEHINLILPPWGGHLFHSHSGLLFGCYSHDLLPAKEVNLQWVQPLFKESD